MANTLKIKRGTNATIPQGLLAEPLFTTDTYDLYIGKGSGGNQRFQKYIASGTSSQFLKGDGSLDSNTYEPSITAGTTLQYWRGDKSWQTLNTAAVPESGAIYFTEPRVLATVLTGLNLSGGGTIAATDSVLTAFGKIQNQISGIAGGVSYQGTWNANTNSPTLTSSVGTKGYYYVVSVNGSTNLNGITDWKVGDWAIFNGTTWDKVDNTDAVSSVNGFTGAVNLGLGNISDVTLSSPTNTQLLRFNGTSSKWENWTPTYISGNETITLSGDISGSGTTAITTTIGALKVTNAMLAGSISYAKMDSTTVPTWNQNTTGSAATLTTARTLTIGATGKTFNGSANVSWTLSEIGAAAALSGTINTIAYWDSASTIASLSTATYPSLTELSYVKGVTSSIQTQLNGKQATLTNPVTGTGTTDYIPQFTGTSAIANSIMQVYATNQIGVGSTPFNSGARFSIDDSNLSLTPLLVKSGYTGAIANYAGLRLYRYDYSTGTDGIGLTFDQTNSSSSQTTYAAIYGYPQTRTAGSEGGLFRIYNKRAGTNTIALEIDQNGNAFMNTKIMKLNTSTSFGTADSYIVLNEPTAASTAGLLLSTNSTLRSYLTSSNAGTTLGVVSGSGPFYINVAASNVLTIAQSGAATFSSSVTADGQLRTNAAGQSILINPGGTASVRMQLQNGTGNAGVVVESSAGGDQFTGTSAYSMVLGTFGARDLHFGTNSVTRMTVTSGGNVGIGTTSPSTRLHIYDSASGSTITKVTFSCGDGGDIRVGKADGVNNNAIFGTWSNNDVLFYSNSAERMRITSGGNVGIGTASPSVKFHVYGVNELFRLETTAATGSNYFLFRSPSADMGYIGYGASGNNNITLINYLNADMTFGTNSAERMRITNGGNVLVNETSVSSQGERFNVTNSNLGAMFKTTGGSTNNWAANFWNNGTSGNNLFVEFGTESAYTGRGSVDYNRGAGQTRYNTTSDANLKNIIGLSDRKKSVDILSSTKIREYSWKEDTTENIQIGVIAQELYETFKGAVSKGSDQELFGTDEYKAWGVDKTAFTFHLIAGWQEHERIIQEQQAQIEELKAKLN